jgi:hypothetical protein
LLGDLGSVSPDQLDDQLVKPCAPTYRPTFRYDPVLRTKIFGITGVTVGLILWALALNATAQIVWYGFWSIFNTLTGGD